MQITHLVNQGKLQVLTLAMKKEQGIQVSRRCFHMGSPACNLLHMIRHTAFRGQSLRPSRDSIIGPLVKVGAGWSALPESSTSMLLRLSLLRVAILSYSPDPRHPTSQRNESTSCRVEVYLKSKKSGNKHRNTGERIISSLYPRADKLFAL